MPQPVYEVCLNDWLSLKGCTINSEDSRGWNAANRAIKFTRESTVPTTVLRASGNGDARSHSCAKVTNRACAQEIKDRVSAAAYKSQGTLKSNGSDTAGSKFKRVGSIQLRILSMLQYIGMDISSPNTITTQTFTYPLDPVCVISFLYWVPQFHCTK